MRTLVTGASGFIGRHAARHAAALGETHVLLRSAASAEALDEETRRRCAVHVADLLDPASVQECLRSVRPSHLLHTAWHGGTADRWTSAANVEWAAASVDLVVGFARQGGERVVVSGSCAEYDWGADRFVEDVTPLEPSSVYGIAKVATSRLLFAAAEELGISVGWGRPFFCYGPAEPPGRLLNDVITGLLEGRRVACTSGLQVRDYLHTDDVGRALAALLDSDFHGAVNIGSGVGISIRDLVLRTAELAGDPDLIDFGARQAGGGEPAQIIADVSRLSEVLHFSPAFTLERGLTQTIDWFRAHSRGSA